MTCFIDYCIIDHKKSFYKMIQLILFISFYITIQLRFLLNYTTDFLCFFDYKKTFFIFTTYDFAFAMNITHFWDFIVMRTHPDDN